ncbi:hypothetical protein V8G54_022412 [Vigna mungo]|uniref:Uncharacterized protein n=1 Tax=Vigna mungo TaxID=3915 RepID=A0AAQ3NHI3_VIGMU
MAGRGSDSQKQLLSLIRNFAAEKSQGGNSVASVVTLRKQIAKLTSELNMEYEELEKAKRCKEMVEQDLKGFEVQLMLSEASNQTLEARVSLIQDRISAVGSDLETLKFEEAALRKFQESIIICDIDAVDCTASRVKGKVRNKILATHTDSGLTINWLAAHTFMHAYNFHHMIQFDIVLDESQIIIKENDAEVALCDLESTLSEVISQIAKENEEYQEEQNICKNAQQQLIDCERKVFVMGMIVKETKELQDLTIYPYKYSVVSIGATSEMYMSELSCGQFGFFQRNSGKSGEMTFCKGTHPLTDFDGFPCFGLVQVQDKFFSSFNVSNEGDGDTRYTYLRLKYFQSLKFGVVLPQSPECVVIALLMDSTLKSVFPLLFGLRTAFGFGTPSLSATPPLLLQNSVGKTIYLGYHDHLEQDISNIPNEVKSQWQKLDFQLCVVLWQYVEQEVLEILRPYKTCTFFWKRAHDIFANDVQRLFYATQRVTSLKQANHDMVAHIGKAGVAIEELKIFFAVDSLEGINKKLDKFYMALILRSVHSVKGKNSIDGIETSPMVAPQGRGGGRSNRGGRGGRSMHPQCTYYKKISHTREKCYALHGNPDKVAHVFNFDDLESRISNDEYQKFLRYYCNLR